MTLEQIMDLAEEKAAMEAKKAELELEPIDSKLQKAIDKVHTMKKEAEAENKRRMFKAAACCESFLKKFKSTKWGIRFTPPSWREFDQWRNDKILWLILEIAHIDVHIHNFDTFELM